MSTLNGILDKNNDTAFLSNECRYSIFSYGEERLKFIAPYSLIKYEKIIEWDNGYLVVLTKYGHSKDYIEEYIDLIPILKNLYIEPNTFLKPIKKVELSYD